MPPVEPLPDELWHWLTFAVLVLVLLALDLFVFHRHDHKPTLRESALFTIFWIAMGLAFNGLVWWWGFAEGLGSRPGVEFLSGYLLEKSLSMDNIFVFVVIFRFFQIPMMYQYRVLFWGILGAIVMRAVFIFGGLKLIEHFHWLIPLFGLFLIYTAYKLLMHSDSEVHPDQNLLLRTARRWFRVTAGDHHHHGHDFFVRENGALCVTPMLLVLLVIESTDVVFAIDSVPAIIAITKDPFIAFTSNIFAILGLRALYFLLAGVIDMFRYLHYGLAAVLGFVGVKMMTVYAIENFEAAKVLEPYVHPVTSPVGSLAVIVTLLTISIGASLVFVAKKTDDKETEDSEQKDEGDSASRKDVDMR